MPYIDDEIDLCFSITLTICWYKFYRYLLMLSGLTLFMLILLFIGVSSAPYFTTNPTYTTNNFFKSGNYRLISTYTNVSSGSWFGSYPFTFSSAFSAVPGLAYGIKAYAGIDCYIQLAICFNMNMLKFRQSHWTQQNLLSMSP